MASEALPRVSEVAGQTQAALYATLDLELSWSEDELPQFERTKHVHGLHPYLGKFIPQLVEVFLRRYFKQGQCVYDPFAGSGTTLVEANVFGTDAIGCDISAFNCLLSDVKTDHYSLGRLELALRGALEAARREGRASADAASPWLKRWYSSRALGELLRYREVVIAAGEPAASVGCVILSRAARSARMTTHFDLDFPRKPTKSSYYCHKHKKTCSPVREAAKFLTRYTNDTVRRLREFGALRTPRETLVLHGDARTLELPRLADGVITSPPYPGLIDYHEQHRYAYELLGIEDRAADEIGPAARGRTRPAQESYVESMMQVFLNTRRFLRQGARVIVVVNDSHDLYPRILQGAGLDIDQRLQRHVNRRTGRRAGEFFEQVLVCRVA